MQQTGDRYKNWLSQNANLSGTRSHLHKMNSESNYLMPRNAPTKSLPWFILIKFDQYNFHPKYHHKSRLSFWIINKITSRNWCPKGTHLTAYRKDIKQQNPTEVQRYFSIETFASREMSSGFLLIQMALISTASLCANVSTSFFTNILITKLLSVFFIQNIQ